jgi:hypothetical protein
VARKTKAEEAAAQGEPAPPVVQAPAPAAAEAKDGVVEPAQKVETPESNPARWMHERLVNQIVEFEKGLDADHEVGGRFVEGPNAEALHIENMASWGPDMIIFQGKYSDGRKFELIQHFSQVSMFLVAIRKMEEAPRRIGFDLVRTMKENQHAWGDPVS